jgi:hypothetical protein
MLMSDVDFDVEVECLKLMFRVDPEHQSWVLTLGGNSHCRFWVAQRFSAAIKLF